MGRFSPARHDSTFVDFLVEIELDLVGAVGKCSGDDFVAAAVERSMRLQQLGSAGTRLDDDVMLRKIHATVRHARDDTDGAPEVDHRDVGRKVPSDQVSGFDLPAPEKESAL